MLKLRPYYTRLAEKTHLHRSLNLLQLKCTRQQVSKLEQLYIKLPRLAPILKN